MPLEPCFNQQLESDHDGGEGDGDEEQEPDFVAIALEVEAEGQHEGDEVAQSLKFRGKSHFKNPDKNPTWARYINAVVSISTTKSMNSSNEVLTKSVMIHVRVDAATR